VTAALQGLTIAVLYGGRSRERDVSLDSAQMVIDALRSGGHMPRTIDTGDAHWWRLLDGVDVAFNIQHGRGGEDGVTQGLLEAMGIPCTGSGVLGSALAMDKVRSKQLWRDAGLPTADFAVVDDRSDFAALLERWGEAFVKPAREGSSIGMSRVADPAAFAEAVTAARREDATVLAERLIDGPEYTVAILGDEALPTIRIEVDEGFYDYQAKYHSEATRYLIPSGLSAQEEEEIAAIALAAFRALDCAVWGRTDLMRDGDGRFQLLEVNTVPGMTSHSLVPMAARAVGLSATALVERILELTLHDAGGAHGRAA
jgi:D-alanine-D-alanine ligase